MLIPKSVEFSISGFALAVEHLLARRTSGVIAVKDLWVIELILRSGERLQVQIDDALTAVLKHDEWGHDFEQRLAGKPLPAGWGPAAWRRQYRQIIKLISMRRLRDAQPDERKYLVFILAYARSALSHCNGRPAGLAAAVETLRAIERIPAFQGEFVREITDWEAFATKQRKLAKLRRQQKRIEAEISRLSSAA